MQKQRRSPPNNGAANEINKNMNRRSADEGNVMVSTHICDDIKETVQVPSVVMGTVNRQKISLI